MELLVLATVFFGVLLTVLAVYVVANRRQLQAAERARAQLGGGFDVAAAISILRDERSSDIPFLNDLLSGRAFTESLNRQLTVAGSTRKPGELVLIVFASMIVGFVLGQQVNLRVAFVGALLGAAAPILNLKRQQAARTAKLEAQLPDALDMLVNALKSGYSLQAAMEFVGTEIPEPLGPEFARFYDEQRLGVEVRMALTRMQERIGTIDARMFVTSLLIQRETGGNLGEVLTNLSTLMRERAAFRGQVRTLTAEPKASARVLACLPPGVFLLISIINPEYMKPLYTNPEGPFFIYVAIALTVVGYLVMSRIADIDM
jgi:tight adherence protein B